MKKILLPIFSFVFLHINCMEITIPATAELPTIDNAAEECACYVAQLAKSDAKAIQLPNQNDVILCCLFHENSGIKWEIKLLVDAYEQAYGMCMDSKSSFPSSSQGVYDSIVNLYKINVIKGLRKNWRYIDNGDTNNIIITKSQNLKHEPLLISYLLKKYYLDEKIKLGQTDNRIYLTINQHYMATVNHRFNFEINNSKNPTLTTTEKLSPLEIIDLR